MSRMGDEEGCVKLDQRIQRMSKLMPSEKQIAEFTTFMREVLNTNTMVTIDFGFSPAMSDWICDQMEKKK